MDPRISFSSDFVNIEQSKKYESSYREAPVSSDFAFSVKKYGMIPADEIFSKGMMVPLRDNSAARLRKTTLRDELLVEDEFEDESPRATKGSGWWKERLGLKKLHSNVTQKCDRNNGVLGKVTDEKPSSVIFHQEVVLDTKRSHSQEMWIEGGLPFLPNN